MTEGTAASMQPTPFSKWKKAVRVLRWIVVASLCSILCREFFVHWNDARAIRFLADGIPFFASLIVLFIPPLHLLTDRMGSAARLVCLIVGASWSAVWWQKELLADRAAQQAEKEMIQQAVTKSNEHSDEKITELRNDVRDVKTDIGSVRNELSSTRNSISESTSSITTSLNKVGKPDPPEKTNLLFTLWTQGKGPLLSQSLSPDKDGVITIDFTFVNSSNTAMVNGEVWIEICSDCTFASDPGGFDKPSGTRDQVRHLGVALLNPGVAYQKTAIRVKTPDGLRDFQVGFKYSCPTCAKPTYQIATIDIAHPTLSTP